MSVVESTAHSNSLEAIEVSRREPTTSTISASVQYRGGSVRRHPQVHDFTITAVVNAPIRTDGRDIGMGPDAAALQNLLGLVATILGHRMLWWDKDVEELGRPVEWPTGIAGPRLPLCRWQVRPTAENIAMWIAGWLAERIESVGPNSALVAVELRESPNLAAVVRGVDIESCKGFPGAVVLNPTAPRTS